MFGDRFFGPRYFGNRFFGPTDGQAPPPSVLPEARVPFVYALVAIGPLSIQTFPGDLQPIENPRTYTAPFLRPENGNDVPGPADFRGFVVVLPAVTRQDA